MTVKICVSEIWYENRLAQSLGDGSKLNLLIDTNWAELISQVAASLEDEYEKLKKSLINSTANSAGCYLVLSKSYSQKVIN